MTTARLRDARMDVVGKTPADFDDRFHYAAGGDMPEKPSNRFSSHDRSLLPGLAFGTTRGRHLEAAASTRSALCGSGELRARANARSLDISVVLERRAPLQIARSRSRKSRPSRSWALPMSSVMRRR
jgi:hypothetical protein